MKSIIKFMALSLALLASSNAFSQSSSRYSDSDVSYANDTTNGSSSTGTAKRGPRKPRAIMRSKTTSASSTTSTASSPFFMFGNPNKGGLSNAYSNLQQGNNIGTAPTPINTTTTVTE